MPCELAGEIQYAELQIFSPIWHIYSKNNFGAVRKPLSNLNYSMNGGKLSDLLSHTLGMKICLRPCFG